MYDTKDVKELREAMQTREADKEATQTLGWVIVACAVVLMIVGAFGAGMWHQEQSGCSSYCKSLYAPAHVVTVGR